MNYIKTCPLCGADYDAAFIHKCSPEQVAACLSCGIIVFESLEQLPPVEFIETHKGHEMCFWPSRRNFDPEYFLAAV